MRILLDGTPSGVIITQEDGDLRAKSPCCSADIHYMGTRNWCCSKCAAWLREDLSASWASVYALRTETRWTTVNWVAFWSGYSGSDILVEVQYG